MRSSEWRSWSLGGLTCIVLTSHAYHIRQPYSWLADVSVHTIVLQHVEYRKPPRVLESGPDYHGVLKILSLFRHSYSWLANTTAHNLRAALDLPAACFHQVCAGMPVAQQIACGILNSACSSCHGLFGCLSTQLA